MTHGKRYPIRQTQFHQFTNGRRRKVKLYRVKTSNLYMLSHKHPFDSVLGKQINETDLFIAFESIELVAQINIARYLVYSLSHYKTTSKQINDTSLHDKTQTMLVLCWIYQCSLHIGLN